MKKQVICNEDGQQQQNQRHKDTERKSLQDRFFRSYETLLNAVQSLRVQSKTALTQGQL